MPNHPHHVVQRGHNRDVVFVQSEDYLYYLEILRTFKRFYGVKVYSWYLIANHVHLTLDPGDDPSSLSNLIKRLSGRQTRRVNRLERRTGPLWEGRIKSNPIYTEK